MTRLKHKRAMLFILTLLMAAAFVLGCPGVSAFAATGNDLSDTESISVGSSLFSTTRYFSISAHEDGLSLRVNEQISDIEYATTTYTSELYMNDFFVRFKINDDNFKTLSLVFHSDYEQDPAKWVLTPAEQTQTLVLEKTDDGKISAKWQNEDAVAIDLDFVGAELTVSMDGNTVKVNDTTVGTAAAFAADRAQLEFRAAGIGEIEWDTDEQVASFYLTEMGYTSPYDVQVGEGTAEPEKVTQSFKSDSRVVDTSRPIARLDTDSLPTYMDSNGDPVNDGAPYYAPLYGRVTVPVSGMDIVRSSITTSIKVKYSETLPADNDWSAVETELDSKKITNNEFRPDDRGYYAVTEIEISDGRNTVTLGIGDSIDGITLPLVYRGFEDITAPVLQNYSDSRGYLSADAAADVAIDGNMLNGGSVTPLQLPYPVMGTSTADPGVQLVEAIGTGYGDDEGETYYANNAKALRYTLYSAADSSTFTSNSGLTFTATSTSVDYLFYLHVEDLKGLEGDKETEKQDTFNIRFRDKDNTIMITVTSFPHERNLNQSVSLPSGSVIEAMGSTTATVTCFLREDPDGNVRYNYEWLYEMTDDGERRTDSDGNYILDLDADGYRQPALYTEADEEENPAHPAGQPIYVDEEGERIDYVLENGVYVMPDSLKVYEVIELSGTTFTPAYLGTYEVRYNAKDTAGNEAAEVVRSFTVVKSSNTATAGGTTTGGFHLNTLSIVFLSIAGACAVAIVVLLCIKPKDKDEDAADGKKSAK